MATNAQAKAYAERIASLEAQLAERTRERDDAIRQRFDAGKIFDKADELVAPVRRVWEREVALQKARAEKAEDEADRNLKAYELIKGDIQVWIRRYDEQKAEVQRLQGELEELRNDLPHCSRCGVVIHCDGSDKEHASLLRSRLEEATRLLSDVVGDWDAHHARPTQANAALIVVGVDRIRAFLRS